MSALFQQQRRIFTAAVRIEIPLKSCLLSCFENHLCTQSWNDFEFGFFFVFSAGESEPGGGGKYKILCVLTRLVALCFIFTRGWGLGTKSTCRKGLGTNTKRHFTHISAMQAALIVGRQRKKGHYLTPWTAQLLPLFVSDLKPDHLSGSGLFWDAAVCRRDSLRRHTRHSDGMTDLESSSSPPNRCPAPVAQHPPHQ